MLFEQALIVRRGSADADDIPSEELTAGQVLIPGQIVWRDVCGLGSSDQIWHVVQQISPHVNGPN